MQRLLKFSLVGSVALAALGCTSTTQPSVTAGNQGPSATSSSNSSEAPKESSKPSEKNSASDEELVEKALLNEDDVAADGSWTISAKGNDPSKPEPDAPPDCPFVRDFYDGATLAAGSPEFRKGTNVIRTFALVYESESDAKAAMDVRRKDQREECQRKGLIKSFTSQGNDVVSFTSEPTDGPGYADEEVFTDLDFTVVNDAGTEVSGGTLYAVSRVGRVVAIVNYKDTAGDVGTIPRFTEQPMDRLRDAQK